MEEKIFTKVDGRAYAEAGIACGELTPVVAVKFARVRARRGVVGEEVVSYSQNGIVEKVATVSEDPETKETGWVLTKLDENGEVIVDEFGHKNEWIVDAKTFDDIVSSYPYTTTFELYSGENMGYVDFFVTPTQFKRYREETNVMGSGSNIYVDRDYSKQWLKFIVERKYKENIEETEETSVQSK